MSIVKSYPKVLTLGSYQTDRALVGTVYIQEKVDGSQFRFGVDEKGGVWIGSHHCTFAPGEAAGMFKLAVDYINSIQDTVKQFKPLTTFFCEFLGKPKQNVIAYTRVPQNNLVLFDAYGPSSGWYNRVELEATAACLGIDVVPTFKIGETSLDELRTFLTTYSFLGGDTVEGVVIKNYVENILENGTLRPLFVKYVRPSFKEKMDRKAGEKKETLEEYLGSFCADARWLKAIQSLVEQGKITVSPKDIGPLIVQIKKDIIEEEEVNIKHRLYRHFINEILRRATAGFPDWYKEKLVTDLQLPAGSPPAEPGPEAIFEAQYLNQPVPAGTYTDSDGPDCFYK